MKCLPTYPKVREATLIKNEGIDVISDLGYRLTNNKVND